jgi:hypothetical protein
MYCSRGSIYFEQKVTANEVERTLRRRSVLVASTCHMLAKLDGSEKFLKISAATSASLLIPISSNFGGVSSLRTFVWLKLAVPKHNIHLPDDCCRKRERERERERQIVSLELNAMQVVQSQMGLRS